MDYGKRNDCEFAPLRIPRALPWAGCKACVPKLMGINYRNSAPKGHQNVARATPLVIPRSTPGLSRRKPPAQCPKGHTGCGNCFAASLGRPCRRLARGLLIDSGATACAQYAWPASPSKTVARAAGIPRNLCRWSVLFRSPQRSARKDQAKPR